MHRKRGHMLADREGGCNAGALDAEQGDNAGHGLVDHEVTLVFAGPVQLGADAGVVGGKRTLGQARPEASYILLEIGDPRRIDDVVDRVDVLEVRPKPRLSAEVPAVVDA